MSGKTLRKIYLLPVRFYRKHISPAIGGRCIYSPTCSAYFTECVMRFGIIKGTYAGIARVLRCNKHYLGGNDPVPESFSMKAVHDGYVVFRRHRIRHKGRKDGQS